MGSTFLFIEPQKELQYPIKIDAISIPLFQVAKLASKMMPLSV